MVPRRKWTYILMIVVSLAMYGFTCFTAQGAVTGEELQQLFNRLDTKNNGNWYKDYNNENGVLAWDESYVMRAYLEMYEATKNTKYLDKFIVHANSVLKQRDSVRGVKDYRGLSLPAWSGGDRYTKNGTLKIFEVHTAMIAQPYAQFATIVKGNPALAGYQNYADQYLKAAKDAVAVHDSQWIQTETEIYMNRPYNMFLALGTTFLEIYQASGETAYLNKAKKIAVHFKNNLVLDTASNSYYWRYMRSGSYTGYEDLSHGAIDVDFAYFAYRNKIVFTETDMQRFGNTIQKKLIKSGGTIADKVTGTGTSPNQTFIGLWLAYYPWAPSLFNTSHQQLAPVKAPQGEDLLSAALLKKVYGELNGNAGENPPEKPEEPANPEPPVTEPPAPLPDVPSDPGNNTGNNVVNGDFSAGKAGWSGTGVVVNKDNSGNGYASACSDWAFYQDLKLAPGEYKLTARTRKGTSGAEARMVVMFIDAAGKRTVAYVNTYAHKGTGWEDMPEKVITVPSSAATTRIYLLTNSNSGYHDYDDISLKENPKKIVSLMVNGDFTQGTPGWSGSDVSVQSEENGNRFASAVYGWAFFQELSVGPGKYKLTAGTKKGTSATEARIVVMFIDASGKRTVAHENIYKHRGAGWESMPNITISVPASAAKTRIYLLTNGGSGYHYYDNLGLEKTL